MHLLLLSDPPTIQQRRFSGVANSGKPFFYQGRRAILDMATLRLADKVPALLLHDRNCRIGFGKLSIADNRLTIDGQLLDNPHAASVVADADNGFPWQMSAHIEAQDTTELPDGQSIEINGQSIAAPCMILKNAVVREVSFTPTGVDNHTSAVILTQDFPATNSTTQGDRMKDPAPADKTPALSQDKADASALLLEQLQAENNALKAAIADLKHKLSDAERLGKKDRLTAKLSAKGFSYSDGGFKGISLGMFELLLSASDEIQDEAINDLWLGNSAPGVLLSEQYHSPASDDRHEQDNPLLSDAQRRQAK